MTAPRILAIDPSLSATGLCLPDGTCKTIKGRLGGQRRLSLIINEALSQPALVDLVVIEECIVGRAVHVESMWLHGGLRAELFRRGTPYVDIHPSRRQKYACGDQKIRDKDAVQHRAWKAGSSATNNDEADAWWLWHMASVAYGGHFERPSLGPLFDYQREVLAAIDWPDVNGHKPQWTAPKRPRKKPAAA